MTRFATILITLLFCGIGLRTNAQYISVDDTYTIDDLVNNVLIDNPCGQGSNVSGVSFGGGQGSSIAYFSGNGSTFPFSDGIILSTGSATSAIGPNAFLLSEGPTSWQGDADLEQALSVSNTINATVLEFDFLPLANKFSFDYIFSSEQYLLNPSQNQCNYTDGFAFLLKKANSPDAYVNIALVPGTDIPVKVNTVRGEGTVCPPANEQWFDAFNDFEHPTNFNGQTKILTASATVEPNQLYHIKLVVADQGNNLYDSAIFLGGGSFKVEKDLGPDRLLATNNPLCPGETLQLDASETDATAYQWFRDNTAIPNETNPVYTASQPGIYSVEINLSSACLSSGEIKLEYAALPTVAPVLNLVQCDPDNDGLAIFDLTQLEDGITAGQNGISVSYFPSMADAQNGLNGIGDPSAFSNSVTNEVVAKASNVFGCSAYIAINLSVTNQSFPSLTRLECDSQTAPDGFAQFNLQDVSDDLLAGLPPGLSVAFYLSQADALSAQNPLPILFTNTVPLSQTIFAKIVNGPDCYGLGSVILTVNTPPAGFGDEEIELCTNAQVTLSAPVGYASYLWSSGEITRQIHVASAGNYTVAVSDGSGCTFSKIYSVSLIEAPVFLGADLVDFSGTNNAITVKYNGNAVYEFSIDGTHFQSSPYFGGLPSGEYDIFIRDGQGCSVIGPFAVTLLDYPHFFTPNADGYNDYWNIRFLTPGSRVSIFDRFGKLLYDFGQENPGWDGSSNGRALPSTDYWFVLKLADRRTVRGHFSLKR